MKNTTIISGFPGVGKSHLFNTNKDFIILDSDSSQFSWVKDEEGNNTKERNPDFPNNYIQHIKENVGKADVILVSSHKIVRDALRENDINYILAYPIKKLKEEYLERYRNRGNDKGFIIMINKNWNNFIDEIEVETFPMKLKLFKNQYLGDILIKHYCKAYGELCSVKETNADEYEFNPCTHCRDGKGFDYRICIS